jgi:hypothetical protein
MSRYFAMVAGAIFFLSGCSNESSKLKGQFLQGCITSGAPEKLCTCAYDEIAAGKSNDELTRLFYSPKSQAEVQNLMMPAVKKCADKL